MNFTKPVTKILNKEQLDNISLTGTINNIQDITNNDYLVTYDLVLNKDLIDELGIYYIYALNTKYNA